MGFGKRAARPEDGDARIEGEAPPPQTPAAPKFVSNGSFPVIVRQSAIEASAEKDTQYALVMQVVDYVNALMHQGLFQRDELLPETFQAYHADFYLAQVNNGGHSQFVHNCGAQAALVFADALAGLEAMGAEAHADIMRRMINWVTDNPEEAAAQTGFTGGRSLYLDELDDEFYKLEKETPMYGFSNAWIKSWPLLKPVSDDDYGPRMETLCRQNPKREGRNVGKSILLINHSLTDGLKVALALAAATCDPSEFLLGVGAGGFDNAAYGVEEDTPVWRTETTGGMRSGIVTAYWSGLFETEDGAVKMLSKVSAEEVEYFIGIANHFHLAAAVDLLLRKADLIEEIEHVRPLPPALTPQKEILVSCLALGPDRSYQILLSERGATLSSRGEEFARVTRAEAETHWMVTEV